MATNDVRSLMEREVDPKVMAQVRVDEAYARGRLAGLAVAQSLNNVGSPAADDPPTREELDEIARRNTEVLRRFAKEAEARAVRTLREERGQP